MKRVHIITDYGVEGWIPVHRCPDVVLALAAVVILLLSGGVAGWLLGAAQTLMALM
jgi:hypothetical protein